MATSRLNLTRDQLATFLKDHEQIKQFERLFASVDQIAPDVVNEVLTAAGSAQATANEALALLTALENSLMADGAVTDAKATLALQEIAALKAELQLKALEPVQQHDNAIVTDYITINPNGHAVEGVGRVVWDDGNGTLAFGLKGGNVNLQVGQEQVQLCYNDDSVTLVDGNVVQITGAQGNRIAVARAQANSEATSVHTLGFATETFAAGAEGFVTNQGLVRKLNTILDSEGNALTEGDTLYLSATISGGYTKVKPLAPNHLVIVGFVVRVHASVGEIFVKVDNGYELDELHNVRITSVANNDLLQYDSAGPYWKNVPASSIPVGTATDLGGGAAGSLPYQSAPSTTAFLAIGSSGTVLTSSGTAPQWTTSTGTGDVVRATSPTLVTPALGVPTSGDFSTGTFSWPTFNQNTTGSAGSVTNAVTFDNSGTGAVSGTTYNGSIARTISYNTIGAQPAGTYVTSVGATAPITSTGGTTPTIGVTAAALTKTDDTNVTLTLGGSPSTSLLAATSLTLGWTGTLAVSRGGTGTGTAFTAGSVVFAGASGTYSQDNANFFWDDTNNRLGIGTTNPNTPLHVYNATGGSARALFGASTTFINPYSGFQAGIAAVQVISSATVGGTFISGIPSITAGDGAGGITMISTTTAGADKRLAAIAGVIDANSTTTTNGRLAFFTAKTGTISERMRIDSSGNVGLGTATPGAILSLARSFTASENAITIQQTAAQASVQSLAWLSYAGTTLAAIKANSNTSLSFNASLSFECSGFERMRLDEVGRLGIGVTAPNSVLSLARAFSASENAITIQQTAAQASVQAINWTSYTSGSLAAIKVNSDTGLSFNASMSFETSGAERARIDAGGNLMVGTTSAVGRLNVTMPTNDTNTAYFLSSAPASPYGLLVDFQADPNNATNYGFKFRLTNNTNIYTIFSNGTTAARSDERFKKDIETTRDGYAEDLSKLRVVKYRWYNAEEDAPKELGFIAQEVEQVFPGLVSTEMNDDGVDVKSIKTSVLVPMLVKAVQEQQAVIADLQARLKALEQA